MITKSYIKLNILFYYASYGLKGLGLYLILYFISESETFCGLPSYLYYNSVFLILVPLLSIGVGSYLLRYSYSERQQKRVLTSFFIFVVAEILVALVISVFSLEYSIVVIWASLNRQSKVVGVHRLDLCPTVSHTYITCAPATRPFFF